MIRPEDLLNQYNLRKTAFRIELLTYFDKTKHALTVSEIIARSDGKTDKATIYRTLMTFEKSGLIHKVPDPNNNARYALEYTENSEVKNHAHFICHSCKKTFCMNDLSVPSIECKEGFVVKVSNLTLEGVCPECIKK
ncbi:Fur family transcriptional regulator [Sediminitomix flava]|uniref:Fur family ferric uptake transcriptional regulator n=1 Tax=Sediminitomix flava TaxID=379075 RepID=A0A315ZBP3_SEDFL|nr:transcriptional repressor [Sediminitomix flava]PWJ42996.1 Fur family ferric uptake transcriptional regulator [Sediminitomix flava]